MVAVQGGNGICEFIVFLRQLAVTNLAIRRPHRRNRIDEASPITLGNAPPEPFFGQLDRRTPVSGPLEFTNLVEQYFCLVKHTAATSYPWIKIGAPRKSEPRAVRSS